MEYKWPWFRMVSCSKDASLGGFGHSEGMCLKLEHGGLVWEARQGCHLLAPAQERAVPRTEQCSQGHMGLSQGDFVPQGH